MRMRMVLIPPWVERAVVASNKPLACVLDVVTLSGILSKEDVAIYMDLNDRLFPKMFKALHESFEYTPLGAMVANGNELIYNIFRKVEDIRAEFRDMPPLYMLTGQTPLFDDDDKTMTDADFMNQYTFEAIYLKDDVFAIRPVLMNKEEPIIKQQIRAYDELIKQLKLHQPLEVIATSSLFNGYVKLLQAA